MCSFPSNKDQLPGEALEHVFKATLELLVAYKDQVASIILEYDGEDDGSDNDIGDDAENGDEAGSLRLQRLTAQTKSFRPADDDDDDSDDDFSDDEDLHSPIYEVDPFIFFMDTTKALQAVDQVRFQNLSQTLDFRYQALASGVSQHADQRSS
ncbi:hypothetical protein Tco_1292359 [Tanacetum coccineum]